MALHVGLPVKSVGLGFAVDAPFELVASRGDVHEGQFPVPRNITCTYRLYPDAFNYQSETARDRTATSRFNSMNCRTD